MKNIENLILSVTVGIHHQLQSNQLQQTLTSLMENTKIPIEILVLSDGVGVLQQEEILNDDLKISSTDNVQGAAACFNRLRCLTKTDVVVFLESGSQLAPGWLECLLEAITAKPHHGIAGPSTNNVWNEQCVITEDVQKTVNLIKVSDDLVLKFGKTWQSLEPLYSIAEFCYVVRRDVLDVLGDADENYGFGPCWEMDYNIRAARAGFTGVWARAAYVHRAPYDSQRARQEQTLFERNKRLYQRKFCARQQRPWQVAYRSHCRGDDCSSFARTEFIQIKLPQKIKNLSVSSDLEENIETKSNLQSQSHDPLVTCIMPTANRRQFITQAVNCFLFQDYSNLELLVLDDGEDLIQDCLPNDERIRYIQIKDKLRLGNKRNLACEQARGEFIFHWDDDDWYPPYRVSRQVTALQKNNTDVCGSSRIYYRENSVKRAWVYQYSNRKWVAGSTLAYRREFWRTHPFTDVHIGEDNAFIKQVDAHSLVDLSDPLLCIATVHPKNTSRKNPQGSLWFSFSFKELENIQLQAEKVIKEKIISEKPKISCILPTCNRRQFIPLTLDNFYAQSYPNKELIIIDDGSQSIEDLVTGLPEVKLVTLKQRTTIGRKRNMACAHASGELIAHWDDDDWYGADRLQRQAQPILDGDADITGLFTQYVLDLTNGEFWCIDSNLHRRMFVGDVHGGTLVFRKSIWDAGAHYPEINLAEDAGFLNAALKQRAKLSKIDNSGCFIYMRHGSNTWKFASGKFLNDQGWKRINAPENFKSATQIRYQSVAKLYHDN